MFRIISFVIGIIFYQSLSAQEYINYTTNVDGVERKYFVYLPASLDQTAPNPMVLNLHGLTSNAAQQMIYSDMDAVADEEGFILVYPDGLVASVQGNTATHWNAGFGTGVDDVGFLDQVITEVSQNHNVDLTRVYSTGMSNGGYMSYSLACSLSDRIAAVASVTGSMLLPEQAGCNPEYIPGIMQIHGTADGTVFYDGVPFIQSSIPALIDFWLNKLECQTGPDSLMFDDIDPSDMSTVLSQSYTDCINGNELLFYKVFNGGHTWPGAFSFFSSSVTNQDINASEHVWDFFSRHTHPNPRIISSDNTTELEINLTLYPNPSSDILFVNENLAGSTYVIYNLIGNRVSAGTYTENGISIDHLGSGVYYLNFKNSPTTKFIKSN